MSFPYANDVALVGRLSGEPRSRPLPSGDEMVSWRLVVERPPGRGLRPRVDTIPCVSFIPAIRALAADWRHGDVIEIRGALRRRFWRSVGGGEANRCEVEVHEADLIAVASAAAADRPDGDGDRPEGRDRPGGDDRPGGGGGHGDGHGDGPGGYGDRDGDCDRDGDGHGGAPPREGPRDGGAQVVRRDATGAG